MERMKQCPRCHRYVNENERSCSYCGYIFDQQTTPPPYTPQYSGNENPFEAYGPEGKIRGVAALLAILLGYLGVQYFYLGKMTAGVLSIILSIVTCGLWSVVTLIQGILMFCMTNEQFRQKYVVSTGSFPIF